MDAVIKPWTRVTWMPGTADDLFLGEEGPATALATAPDTWTYSFKEREATLHDLRKRINLYEHEEGASTWEYYKKVINPYELVYTQKKYDNFPESVCIYHPLSRSYFKIIEMLAVSDFFKLFKSYPKLRSAHVCEGPGGFIQGFLEECDKRHILVSRSTAITLRPNQQNVPGWKRAATFLHKHKNVKVVYGPDTTGDLLNYENQNAFIEECGEKVHFMTGDGGFDFSTDYDSQEKTIFPLLIASVRVSLEVLADGGVFILKFLDVYYDGTRDLISFLTKFFSRWTLYKPATSRPCNPEVYFIGVGFKRPPPVIMDVLRTWSQQVCRGIVPVRLFSGEHPLSCSSFINECIEQSVVAQEAYLRKVFIMIEPVEEEAVRKKNIQTLLKRHEIISYEWCKTFSVPVYPQRYRSIEASRTYLRDAGLL